MVASAFASRRVATRGCQTGAFDGILRDCFHTFPVATTMCSEGADGEPLLRGERPVRGGRDGDSRMARRQEGEQGARNTSCGPSFREKPAVTCTLVPESQVVAVDPTVCWPRVLLRVFFVRYRTVVAIWHRGHLYGRGRLGSAGPSYCMY